jgi:4'-phosphopantetheinyl transferase EntD
MTPVDDIPHLELAERVRNVEARLRTDQVETAREHGLPRDLFAVEESIWKRLSPFKNRWPAEFDMRVAELEQQQAEIQSELADLHARANAAPDLDAAALADWELSTARGRAPRRPYPTSRTR